jgi:hypothetical protein
VPRCVVDENEATFLHEGEQSFGGFVSGPEVEHDGDVEGFALVFAFDEACGVFASKPAKVTHTCGVGAIVRGLEKCGAGINSDNFARKLLGERDGEGTLTTTKIEHAEGL